MMTWGLLIRGQVAVHHHIQLFIRHPASALSKLVFPTSVSFFLESTDKDFFHIDPRTLQDIRHIGHCPTEKREIRIPFPK